MFKIHLRAKSRGQGPGVALKILGGLLWGAALILGLGGLVMLLWNQILVAIFGIPALTYWQGVGLLILTKVLFGIGHPPQHPMHRKFEKHMHDFFTGGHDAEALRQYWQEEGQTAFNEYLKRQQTPEPGK